MFSLPSAGCGLSVYLPVGAAFLEHIIFVTFNLLFRLLPSPALLPHDHWVTLPLPLDHCLTVAWSLGFPSDRLGFTKK